MAISRLADPRSPACDHRTARSTAATSWHEAMGSAGGVE